jgi:hypothetical protein
MKTVKTLEIIKKRDLFFFTVTLPYAFFRGFAFEGTFTYLLSAETFCYFTCFSAYCSKIIFFMLELYFDTYIIL